MTTSRPIYAIGDIHGHAGLLDRLLAFVETDAAQRGHSPKVIFLGDIVDRGPENRRAMELVCAALERWPDSRLLLGNHDSWLLEFFDQGEADPAWLMNGGGETLQSYGLADLAPAAVREHVARDFHDHFEMLRDASIQELAGTFAFVHAGVNPNRPIPEQDAEDCIWIRAPFLNHVGRLSHTVVHGHTPMIDPPCPVITENRISLDTGAFATGVLSLMILDVEGGTAEFHATGPDGSVTPIEPLRVDRGHGTAL